MPTIDMRLLVIAADGNEPDLAVIRQTLDYLGTPYQVYIATQSPGRLTPDVLSRGDHAFYQGIILTTGNLAYLHGSEWICALSPDELRTLRAFEARFGIRQLTWYTYPTPEYGFETPAAGVDTTSEPIRAGFTPAGRSLFSYVNTAYDLPIQGVYAYLAPPLVDEGVVPLLQDVAGNALALVRTDADGRQNLALTFDSNAFAMHSLILSYGLIYWVTKGLFVGERHIYLSAQVDDMLIGDRERRADLPCDSPGSMSGLTFRMSGADLSTVVSWQESNRVWRVSAELRLTFAFNGCGSLPHNVDADTLLPEVIRLQDHFYWVSHTYDHEAMDDMDYAQAQREIQQNLVTAEQLGLTRFSPLCLVTPAVSGLNNPAVLQAAHDSGVRYLVSDASRQGQSSPSPNAGIFSSHQPALLAIPRRPTNLYYDVTTPEEWVAEYNCQYASHWGRDLTYEEILDRESQAILLYLVLGDMQPIMFHQANLHTYERGRTLLSDLLDRTLAKYEQLLNVPISCPTMDELGRRMAARMQYNDAGITARFVPGQHVILSAQHPATVPVTGLASQWAECFGEHTVSYIQLEAGQLQTLPLY